MTDITTLSTKELLQDYADSQLDIHYCQMALAHGIVTYGENLSVRSRLETSRGVSRTIEQELLRRGILAMDGVQHGTIQ